MACPKCSTVLGIYTRGVYWDSKIQLSVGLFVSSRKKIDFGINSKVIWQM